MKWSFIFVKFLLFTTCLFSENIVERLAYLLEKDCVIYDSPRSMVVINVQEKKNHLLYLDIVTATKDILEREKISSWLEWYQKGMPSACIKDEIILSLSTKEIIQTSSEFHNNWLLTLFSLDMKKLSNNDRKKAGPTPMPGEKDFRPIWHPQIKVDSKKIESKTTAFVVNWPEDSSPLSKKEIILYFPDNEKAVSSLPYLIESPSSSYKIFSIDSKRADS